MMDKHLAERAVGFMQNLNHVQGEWAGSPFVLEAWQKKFIKELFGRVDKDSLRQYRTCYVEIPRKNGKSMTAAAVALYMLFCDGEPGAQIYSAAAERNQAALVFNTAAAMVRRSPALSKICKVVDSQKRIVYYKQNSFYQAISADADTKQGFNAHCVIYDELHCAPNRNLWDALVMSMGARRQPLMLAITTAGWNRNSICWEMHDYADKVRRGFIDDPSFLPVLYGADDDDDWSSPLVWKKANPNLGVSVKMEYLKTEYKRALEIPAYENSFRRYFLNQWTSQEIRWLPMKDWDECDATAVDLDELEDERCYMGLDLSATTDLTSLSLFFPDQAVVLNWSWMPEDLVGLKERTDRVPYWQWVKQGLVEITPGNVVDYAFIRERINSIATRFTGLQRIGYDPWNATQLMIQVEQDDGLPVVPVRQGYKTLSPACKELERLVVGHQLRHGGSATLRWAAENVTIKADENENIRPCKSTATGRIDPLMSLVIAIAAMQQTEGLDGGPSVYDERGILML